MGDLFDDLIEQVLPAFVSPTDGDDYNTIKAVLYETRRIVVAQGIEYHESDYRHRTKVQLNEVSDRFTDLGWLRDNLGDGFEIIETDKKAQYRSDTQKVLYKIDIVNKKSEFIKSLATPGIIVVYAGHSRYGRGACFDQYDSGPFPEKGEQWENGGGKDGNPGHDAGLFRLGYPFVPVPLEDVEKHQYHFAPAPVTDEEDAVIGDTFLRWGKRGKPLKTKKHPHNFEKEFRHKKIQIFTMPEALREYVIPQYRSTSDQYYGFWKREGGKNVKYFILHAGWIFTQSIPYELGSTVLQCRTFCHFGCSSKQHYWEIIRKPEYYGWERPKPPTERFAYFTDRPGIVWKAWLLKLLSFPEENDPADSGKHWWRSHQYAKKKGNQWLRAHGQLVRIY